MAAFYFATAEGDFAVGIADQGKRLDQDYTVLEAVAASLRQPMNDKEQRCEAGHQTILLALEKRSAARE